MDICLVYDTALIHSTWLYGNKPFVLKPKILQMNNLSLILAVNKNNIIEAYKLCWNIETLFGNLKSRGFNLEATRVSKP